MNTFNINESAIESSLNMLKQAGLCENGNIDYQLYTLRHKQAFVAVQLALTGSASISGLKHDAEKLFLYGIMSKKDASKIHLKYSRHHIQNCITQNDLRDCIVDYECARFTKKDKPLNALNTILTYCPDKYELLVPTLLELKLHSKTNVDINFRLWNQLNRQMTEAINIYTLSVIQYMQGITADHGLSRALELFYARD